MSHVSTQPAAKTVAPQPAPVTQPTVEEVLAEIRQDQAQAADYLADTEVPFGGE